ncbi:DUF4157 domain-containing protein [Pseudoflavonifractor capillosus]|uniref:eCIS core domain-containing protein n=1 Tax=Pseudoflavonifractor capillosus TaxID=106588 RepID=UPI0031F79E7F
MRQAVIQKAEERQRRQQPNLTGIPTQMKMDFEQRSGLSFDDVRVHYNSDKPRKIGALAYTQIPQVHIGPGQERHLRHELGHVVQQKQGIVRPTKYINGLPVNDSPLLEHSASHSMFSTFPFAKSSGADNTYHAVQMIAAEAPGDSALFDATGNFADNEPRYLIKSIQIKESEESKAATEGKQLSQGGQPIKDEQPLEDKQLPEGERPSQDGQPSEDKQLSEGERPSQGEQVSEDKQTAERKEPQDGLEKSVETVGSTDLHSPEVEVASDAEETQEFVLRCEKIGSGSSDALVLEGKAKDLFKEIETRFDYQLRWIEEYYNTVMNQLPNVAENKKPQYLEKTELLALQLLTLQRAAIVSSSNLGEDAYTFFKKPTSTETEMKLPISQLYFADQNNDNLMLSLNKARIYTGLIQEWVMSMVQGTGSHAHNSGNGVFVIKPNTSLTSQLLSPCIAMIVTPDNTPIVCLNSATYLQKVTGGKTVDDQFAKMTQFEPKNNGTIIRIGLLPKYISPQIGARLRALSIDDLAQYTKTAGAGTHAEVRAANKYFKAYGSSTVPEQPSIDLRIAISNKAREAAADSVHILDEFAKCPHCATILDDCDKDGKPKLGVKWTPSVISGGASEEDIGKAKSDVEEIAKNLEQGDSAKESIQAAVRELGFKIVDRQLSATPPRPVPDPRRTGMKRPHSGSPSKKGKPRSGDKVQ